MQPLREEIRCQPGDDVVGSDDHKIGKVTAVDPRYLTVQHGLLSKSNYYIPTDNINACADGKVYLNVAKDAVANAGWDMIPSMATDAGNPPLTPP